jgi:aminopeptidase N
MPVADPHSFCDPDQGTIARIDFQLEPDFSQRVLRVRARYDLDRPVRGSLFLDSKDLGITHVDAGGSPVRWSFDRDDPILGQRVHLSELAGVDRLTIDLTTSPKAAALQWLDPVQTAGGVHPFLYTQCQACSARTLFPCQDTPGVRFTYEAEVSAPDPLVAVMAAELVGVRHGGGRAIHRFVMPQPIPSYLFAFAVGNIVFDSIGPRTGVYAEPEILGEAVWELAENEDKLRIAEGLFGPYLWDRYDVLIMPAAFPYGGMENPRLTFLNSCYLQGDRSGAFLIAHELAHAWTGNLVTNATWEDFWLNEGPTTYAETRITEIVEGFATAELRTAGRAARLERDIERLGPTSPMTCLKLSLAGKDPDESYSNIPYFKGLLLFRRLEQAVGRARFDGFLRDYIEAFRFRSITSGQFVEFVQERLPDVTRQVDLRRWIYAPGLPEGAAEVRSTLLDDVQAVVAAYRQGTLPSAERVGGWTGDQRIACLSRLLPGVPASDCAYFESLFQVGATRVGDLRSRFFELAIRSGYREALADYEAFFASVGRYAFHEPVFRALVEETWSRPLARPLLDRWRHRHHAHTVAAMERVLTEAGL